MNYAAKKLVGETGFAPARASAHEFLRLACIRSTTRRKLGAAGAACTPTRREAQRFLRPPGLRFPHGRMMAWSRRPDLHRHGPSRPTGFESVVFPIFTTPRSIGADGGSCTLTSLLTGFSLRRVSCFATSAKTGASTGMCALLPDLPRQSVAFYGLDAKMVEAEGLAPSQPARAARLQRAAIAALPRFEKWGSSGIRTRDLLLMRELR